MTWTEMHIGIDLGLQSLNSNIRNQFLPEAKDFLLNRVIRDMVKQEVNKILQNKENVYSLDDIRHTSSFLNPLLRLVTLDQYAGSNYVYVNFPKDTTPVTSGKLYAGRTYKVSVAGTTNLTNFGGGNPTALNTTFTCVIANKTANALQIGAKYKIVSKGTTDFTTCGAVNNMVNTEFIATTTGNGNGTVTPLNETPTWAGGTSLLLTTNESVFDILTSASNVDKTTGFAYGSLKKGVTYKITKGGTISNLVSFGASSNTVEIGYMFTCTTDGVPTWDGNVTLVETKDITNKLVLASDIFNMLGNSFADVTSSPVSTMINNQLQVFTQNKITVNRITLVYVTPPISIDSVNDINTNIHESFHDTIVDRTVEYIMGRTNNPNYERIVTDNAKNNR